MKQSLMLIPILAILLAGSNCRTHVPHPGQIDNLDGQTYDTLTVAQSVLDNARIQYTQGKLPATAKPVINGMGAAYNELRDLWIQYRANPDASLSSKILTATNNVNQFILELRKQGVK